MKHNKINVILAVGLIIMAAAARIVNHELHLYNLAPVAAIGLFGGAALKDRRLALVMPLLAMFIGDLYIELFPSNATMRGFYGVEQLFVYGSMLLVTVLGLQIKQVSAPKVLGYSLAGSLIFFALSNFGSYITGMYGYGWNAFTTTYVMALPFFRNTVVSDLAGNVVLFGGFALLQQAFSSKLQRA